MSHEKKLQHSIQSEFNQYVAPAIHYASTILFPNVESLRSAQKDPVLVPSYARAGTPIIREFEQMLAEMEDGYGSVATPSGISAITLALMAFLKAGDHVLITDSVYHVSRHFFEQILKKFGVTYDFFDPMIGAGIADLIKPETKMLYLESPGSLTYEVMDVESVCNAAKEKRDDILIMIDNSWATPLLYQPFYDGVDLIIHAVTKYLAGHCDLMLGAIVAKSEPLYRKLKETLMITGICAAPDTVYMAMRGMKTLQLRMIQHHENVIRVIRFLNERPEIQQVLCPALPNHPGHQVWLKKFKGSGSLFSVLFKPEITQAMVDRMINSLQVFKIGLSWGGFESLAIPLDLSARQYNSLPKGCVVRFYSGLEPVQAQIADLKQSFTSFGYIEDLFERVSA